MSVAIEVYRKKITDLGPLFAAAIPATARKYLTPERLTQVACNALGKNDKLLECTQRSVLAGIMDISQLGLEVAGPLGHAYLVPFKSKGVLTATVVIGYKGYIALSMRSGLMSGPPNAQLVKARDLFEFDRGSGKPPHHPVDTRVSEEDRGEIVGAYCVSRFGGDPLTEWMSADHLAQARARSKMANAGAWVSDTEQMFRKTVIRRAKNYWPLSAEMAQAFELDDAADNGADTGQVYDMAFEEVLGEVAEQEAAAIGKPESKTSKTKDALKKRRGEEPQPAPAPESNGEQEQTSMGDEW